jgi:hypothetical protein
VTLRPVADLKTVRGIIQNHPDYFDVDLTEWLANPLNLALQEGQNIAFAEFKSPGVYWVHFCFDEARGRRAIELTQKMFSEFCRLRPVQTAIGMIALENRKARWLIRQVGFTSLGEVDGPAGPSEMFYATKELADNGFHNSRL